MRSLALVCLAQVACATSPAVSSSGGDYRFCSGDDCYQLGPLDPSWRVVRRQEGEIGFFNAAVGGVIQSNTTCRKDAEAVPLSALTDHLLIGYTARRVRSSGTLSLARREALRTVLDARLDGVPFVLDLYVFKRNGCIFDLSFAAPPGGYERGAADFQRFVGGFIEAGSPARS